MTVNGKSHVGMEMCFFCGEAKGVVLDRRLRDSLPKSAIYNMEPCDTCKEMMAEGIMLIQVRDGELNKFEDKFNETKSPPNPYRTGRVVLVVDDLIRRLLNDEMAQLILDQRWAFVEVQDWNAIGLDEGADPDIPRSWDEYKKGKN